MRSKVLTVIGFTMLIGFATIGFFAIPIGITVCAIIGLCYGCRKHDKPFIKWSVLALVLGVALIVYTLCLIGSM